MTELIVALDAPLDQSKEVYDKLKGTVTTFKVGAPTLLQFGGLQFARAIAQENRLMLDIKLYDTRDTVLRAYRAAAQLNAHMVTVHVDVASYLEFESGPITLAVDQLTDQQKPGLSHGMKIASGVVCHPALATTARMFFGPAKIIVCPGIRPTNAGADNHLYPATPAAAAHSGADYIVVGRPIWQNGNPLAAAQRIIEELGNVG